MNAAGVQAAEAERRAALPSGTGERFTGYGVMGLPFTSGHVLALRRFPASSIGPAYTAVWHRDPDGRWEFWQDQPADQACSRYFGSALAATHRADIRLDWPSGTTLQVTVPDAGLIWAMTMGSSVATRALNAIGSLLPDRAWRAPRFLAVMGPAAGAALRAGRVAMAGNAPNGHAFVTNPQRIWLVTASSATLGGQPLGPQGPLARQAQLGDFLIPQRGIFATGRAFFATP